MKILKFQFYDKSLEWRLEELSLNRLTLLVGASGVGKTQILKSLAALKQIAEGQSLNGVEWSVEFETLDANKYVWTGEFENKDIPSFLANSDGSNSKNKYSIIKENVWLNDELIVERDSEKILFNGFPTLKLSSQESIISLLREENVIKPAYEELIQIRFSSPYNVDNEYLPKNIINIGLLLYQFDKANALDKIQNSDYSASVKLFFVFKLYGDLFNKIKQRFINIFPQVEDIKIAPLETKEKDSIPNFMKDNLFIQIKEKGVKNWIDQTRMSSGMFRTLIQLSEIYLCAEGTVFLIDEFENSLGVNCMDELTNDILSSKRNLQFILTSHHPYIINGIKPEYWKLVTRNAGVVKTHNADEYNIGKSKHSAFMQLIQLNEYQTGAE